MYLTLNISFRVHEVDLGPYMDAAIEVDFKQVYVVFEYASS